MKPSSIVWTRLAQAVAIAILAFNVYRAATCSITIDEAFTYNRFVRPAYSETLLYFDANQHVLYTLLAKATVGVFGVSEFTLRLPGVLGGALYLWVALALSRMIFGSRPMLVPALALLALNPLVLDYMSMARGYGAGLACWLGGLYLVAGWPPSPSPWQMRLLALALTASVGFNLIFIPPGLALVAWCAADTARQKGAWAGLLNHTVLPGIVGATLLLVLPMARAEPGSFYVGEKTLWKAVISISHASLLQGMHWLPARIRGWDDGIWNLANVLGWAAAACMIAGIPAGVHAMARARRVEANRVGVAVLAITWMVLAMLVAGHYIAQVPYPYTRTGIYWIPLLTLLALWLYERAATYTAARVAGCTLACAWLLLYALQIHPTYYSFFRGDAGTKHFVDVLRSLESGSRTLRLGVNWQLEQGFNFYRSKYGLNWIAPVERYAVEKPAEYYVLLPEDLPLIDKLRLQVVQRHPVSKAVLARPVQAASSP